MTLVKFKNRSLLDNLVNDSFNNGFYDSLLGSRSDINHNSSLNYKVKENEANYELNVAVPGFTKEDLNISVDKGLLSIKTVETEEGEERSGFASVDIEQNFRLSKKINQDNITAKVENGVLTIVMAKKEEEIEKPARQIEIA